MKKISLLKGLAILGAVTLSSVCVVETALLIHKNIGPENSDPINLNTYDSYTLAETLEYAPVNATEAIRLIVIGGIKNGPTGPTIHPITDKEDIDVTISTSNQQILVFAKNNSATYVQGSHATISYGLQAKQTLASIFGSDPIVAHMDDKYDDDFTKAYILNSLQSQYPALNINHLDVAITKYAQENEGTAVVSIKSGSNLYDGSNAAVTYYTSGSVIMTLDKYLIKPGDTATASFKFHNATPSTGLTYTMPVAAQTGTFTWTGNAAGTLAYNTNNVADFAGGSYEIVGTYINGDKTYVSRCIVYAQSNISIGDLTIPNTSLKNGTTSSGTPTMKVNGAVVTSNVSYKCFINTTEITTTPSGEGMTFSTAGVLTWDSSRPTNGGRYVITATYSGTNIKTTIASETVYVAANKEASLTLVSKNINATTKTTGTPSFYMNGSLKNSGLVTWTVTGGLTNVANTEGLSFAGGTITWNGTSQTKGGTYTIIGTYTPAVEGAISAVATAEVSVQASHILTAIPFVKTTGWTVSRNNSKYDSFNKIVNIDIQVKKDDNIYSTVNYVAGIFTLTGIFSFPASQVIAGWITYEDCTALCWLEPSGNLITKPPYAFTNTNATICVSGTFYSA